MSVTAEVYHHKQEQRHEGESWRSVDQRSRRECDSSDSFVLKIPKIKAVVYFFLLSFTFFTFECGCDKMRPISFSGLEMDTSQLPSLSSQGT